CTVFTFLFTSTAHFLLVQTPSLCFLDSCVGRCGESFTRGQQCTCDFSCLQHNECCHDFEATCSTGQSCRGRCGEAFRRGQLCECDPECVHYNTCCHDYQGYCGKQIQYKIHYNYWPVSSPHIPHDNNDKLNNKLCLCKGVFADQNLCSDSPINGLTVLSNGTMLIFKGELFWSVNPVSRSVGRPKNILDNLGVPSPIDTIFTRCNCKGNTYIIKGDQYWLLDENMVMEPGFPKPLASEFPGLTGSISAALAAPATRSRSETVFFFKKGDVIQRFTFPSGSTPSCGNRQTACSTNDKSLSILLSKEIKIKSSLKGFPIPVTSALSIPSPRRSDPYQHYVFSGSLFFNIKISGNLPALAKPDPDSAFAPLPLSSPALAAPNTAAQNRNPPQPTNSIKVWLQCP
uniref:Proteoglycan 4a n=1 Tax=Labrus bergylta TaxID=56723 RepID=A0A3Q3G5I8_9LABR